MKRNFDLIRKIMLDIENLDPNYGYVEVKFGDEDARAVDVHAALLIEAGLLNGKVIESEAGIIHKVFISGISWAGYEFIDYVKNDTVWNKAKETVLKPAVSASFQVLLEWAKQEAKNRLGLP